MRILQRFLLILNIVWAENLSSLESWSTLFEANEKTHATPHITNIIRNSPENLSADQIKNLETLDIYVKNNIFLIERPLGLTETYNTDHFKFHFVRFHCFIFIQNKNKGLHAFFYNGSFRYCKTLFLALHYSPFNVHTR